MDKKINTIKMTRKIRDEHAKQLVGKSNAERISFYREHAKKFEKKLPALLSKLAITSGGKGNYSKDRHKWLDAQDKDTVLKGIRERRAPYKKKK